MKGILPILISLVAFLTPTTALSGGAFTPGDKAYLAQQLHFKPSDVAIYENASEACKKKLHAAINDPSTTNNSDARYTEAVDAASAILVGTMRCHAPSAGAKCPYDCSDFEPQDALVEPTYRTDELTAGDNSYLMSAFKMGKPDLEIYHNQPASCRLVLHTAINDPNTKDDTKADAVNKVMSDILSVATIHKMDATATSECSPSK